MLLSLRGQHQVDKSMVQATLEVSTCIAKFVADKVTLVHVFSSLLHKHCGTTTVAIFTCIGQAEGGDSK